MKMPVNRDKQILRVIALEGMANILVLAAKTIVGRVDAGHLLEQPFDVEAHALDLLEPPPLDLE